MKSNIAKIASSFAVALLALGVASPLSADTSQDFDNPGTPFVGASFGPRPAPTVVGPDGFSTGNYLRLLSGGLFARTQNSVGFDLSDAGAFNRIIADFDFRITCSGARFGFSGGGCADGFSFLLLDTAVHGISGAPQPTLAEHGVLTLQSQFSLGFNTFQNGTFFADAGSSNSLSLLVNGNIVPGSPTALSLATFDLATGISGNKGPFHHAQIDLVLGPGTPKVTVTLTHGITGHDTTPFLNRDISTVPSPPGPIERRVAFAARCGDACADYNLDNINVQYLDPVGGPGIEKEITSGPDLDGVGGIDIAIQILQTSSTAYDWELTYVPAASDPVNVVIIDTVPAEWDVTDIDGNPVTDTNDAPHKGPNQGDGLGVGCGRSESGLGNDGNVKVERGGRPGRKCSSSTDISWTLTPSLVVQTLLVDVTTRQSPSGKLKFKPTECGKLTLNDGAVLFEANPDGTLVLRVGGVPGGAIDPINGEPVPIGDPSNSLMLVALDDLNGGGLVGDGTGDEDGDTLEDADEAFNIGTDPCNPDTDGDGVPDNLDQCPLEGPPGAGETNVDGCNIPD